MKEENQIYADHEVVQDLSEEDLIVYELAHSGNIANSERIAYMVEDQLKNRAQRKSRGVRQKGLVVLYQSTMPAILVETGFLTNPAEKRYLTSDWGQSLIASAIYRAIKQYKQEQDESYSLKATSAND
jgi:N-acetylmuramoyl-L-alanine amidase